MLMSPTRDNVIHIQLLEKVNREFPGVRWLIIEDNLIIHANRQASLAFTAWTVNRSRIPQAVRVMVFTSWQLDKGEAHWE